MIYIIGLMMACVSGEFIDYKITMNSPNYFDSKYIIVSKNYGDENIFGYDEDEACFIKVGPQNIIAYTQKMVSFEQTSGSLFENKRHPALIKIINCFKYNQNSYIIYKHLNNNESVIIKGKNNIKYFSNLNYEDIKYDYDSKNLYLIKNNMIYQVNMKNFEEIWKEIDNSLYGKIEIFQVSQLDNMTTDLIIMENNIFIIKQGMIYKRKLRHSDYTFVGHTNSEKFNLIFFKPKYHSESSNPFNFYLIIPYIVEFIIIFIGLYIIKYTKLLKRNKNEHFPIFMEMEVYDKKNEKKEII